MGATLEPERWAGRAELRVASGGPVVPPERVSELFEPFRGLDGERTASGQGLGLGLSIVRAVALAHGGQVEANPIPGGGLELLVRLDVLASQPDRPASLPDRPASLPERQGAALHSGADANTDELLAGSDRLHR